MSAPAPISPDWIAVDWGTSNLRAYAMSAAGDMLGTSCSDQGMGVLAPDAFEPALRQVLAGWTLPDPCTIVACGMVGSRQGWQEAPYRAVPCDTRAPGPVRVTGTGADLRVFLLPGVKQMSPPDVMRGEETQIAGFLALNDGWDGVICLPGTHSKWAHVSAGEIVSFRTFMSGELFQTLGAHTVLRHSLSASGTDPDMDLGAFDAAVSDTLSRPETLAGALFTLRAADLLTGQSATVTRARLSGALIGAELAAAKPYWLGQRVAIVGSDAVSALYGRALAAQGVTSERCDAGAITRAGLISAYTSV